MRIFKKYPSVRTTKGYSRSLIFDLERGKYSTVPNSFIDFLKKIEGKSLDEIQIIFSADGNIRDKYINFLIENYYGNFFDKNIKFKEYVFKDSAFDFEYVMFDYSKDSNYGLLSSIEELSQTYNIKILQLRFFDIYDFQALKEIFEELHFSSFRCIELYVSGAIPEFKKEESIKKFLNSFLRIRKLYLYNTRIITTSDSRIKVIKSEKISEKSCGNFTEDFFAVNLQNYLLSKHKNNCLYKKISIDKFGEVKNCPAMSDSLGNISSLSLNKINLPKKFLMQGEIRKDQISVCRNCEFREICTDCRAFRSNPEDIFSKPLKCGYDPYRSEWKDWTKSNLAAIENYGL